MTSLNEIGICSDLELESIKASAEQDQTLKPDSRVLVIRPCPGEFKPTSAWTLPVQRSLIMKQRYANELAIMLNRGLLEKRSFLAWHVVVALRTGHCVLRVVVGHNWIPEDEYALPPNYLEPMTVVQAKQTFLDFNREQMQELEESGQAINRWAVHIKPLSRPEFEFKFGDTKCTAEVSIEDLNEFEKTIVEALQRNLNYRSGDNNTKVVDVSINDHKVGRFLKFPEVWNSINITSVPPHEVAMMLRDRAGELLQAANEMSGETTPEVCISQPLFHEVSFESNDYVSLMLMNCEDEKEALRRGAQFLSRMKAGDQLTQLQPADAA